MKRRYLLLFCAVMMLTWQAGCRKLQSALPAPGSTSALLSKQNVALSTSAIFTNALPSADNGSYYDPWVIYVGGFYYYCGSDGDRLWITLLDDSEHAMSIFERFIPLTFFVNRYLA